LLTTFYGIDLRTTVLEGSQFERVVFFNCDQRGKDYARHGFTGCQFTENQLDGADFSGAQLTQCNFKGASLQTAQLNQVNATQALFMEANLRGAQCRGSVFDQAIFVGATLEQADFSQSRLFQSIPAAGECRRGVFYALRPDLQRFYRCRPASGDLRGATFSRTRMHRANQENARFTGRQGILEYDEELLAAEAWSLQRQSRR
jgi:uncharacterized protein YjbI with pentapeptide repeats